jgi:fibronectin type 3 domain-containing protein
VLTVAVPVSAALSLMPAPSGAQPQGGISVDQYRRMFPPAPQNLRAKLQGAQATISWDAPPEPPPGRIGYDPEVAAYNVYLVGENLERRRLGQTRARNFIDPETLGPGEVRHYAVTAVQRSGIESGMPDRVELRTPAR